MKILLDMNLSPQWCGVLRSHGHECVHWASVGDVRADDARILNWALANDHIVITHDLDFGAILAATGSAAPSVVLLRCQDILPSALQDTLVRTLKQHADALTTGALIALDETRARVRVLPLRR